MDFRNKRVTVMGLGHFGGGVGAAQWLVRQGAKVTVTDLADEQTLAKSLAKLEGFPIAKYHLAGHREEDFRGADLVVVNPAVRPANPFLKIAEDANVPICCELELFMNSCPAKIIGVTGANGKSTTVAMIASILKQSGDGIGRQTWLGGNFGRSLLEPIDFIRPDDWVVLEISSFQLSRFSPQVRMPGIAVITGCTPNHLDWHATLAEYIAAKQKLLRGQSTGDSAVLNPFDAEVAGWSRFVRGRQLPLYPPERLPERMPLPGTHNRLNAALAATAAMRVGCVESEIDAGLRGFSGLPQRLQCMTRIDGRHYYNDSAATTPESTIAALRTFGIPVWILAGGRNKGFDFSELAAAIVRYAQGAAFFGSCRDELEKAVAARLPEFPCSSQETLAEALDWCRGRSHPGEAIVLSPGCASTDQFQNFRQRGEAFNELVMKMAEAESE
jgi:UDP-N-acetylmuramoylalanine--D-glutamate ligase